MSKSPRTPLTSELVARMAEAAGSPIAPDHLDEATALLDALFDLEAVIDERLDVSGIEPEFGWDPRWSEATA